MIGQYFKAKDCELVIYAPNNKTKAGYLCGVVVIPSEGHELGKLSEYWHISEFEPCEAPQGTETTKPDPTPANDTDLRLECLKLAVSRNNAHYTLSSTQLAQDFYDWITQTKPNID